MDTESSTAELEVTEAFVRWLVVEQQGVVQLSLRRKGPAEGGDPAFGGGAEWRQPGWRPDPEWLSFKASV